ncbi:endonuclease/exonuclease/phosphatase family protein [Antrihabitans sp. YC3-6]|uniref:Endonuclease/exonuclease/phosphatase family protein n=1 Tax=Antrihabitans stalagmiti TaxID=2799499 RepID=A0A934NLS0_9NOCA|nr:endonuclease/exonuclease/phosphatase family protein [Antrihabitans stalagmiti]MBJ8337477.1 endonuclease/exonuclease/phosphatase family protein [Antrihabitans stalagmiti]
MRTAVAAGVLLVAICVVLTWLPAGVGLPLDRLPVVAQLTAFRVHLAVLAVAAAVVVAFVRPFSAVVLGVVGSISVATVFPQSSGPIGTGVANLRVLTVNVGADSAHVEPLADLIRQFRPDVIAMPEGSSVYAREIARLVGPGFDVFDDTIGTRSAATAGATSLLIRSSLRPAVPVARLPLSLGTVTTTVTVAGHAVNVHAVHPNSPNLGSEATWDADLAALVPPCRSDSPTVIAGDLNATFNHSRFRELIGSGCRASGGTLSKLTGSWPNSVPAWLGVRLDQVLTAGPSIVSTEVWTVDVSGGQHRAVIADLMVG